MLRQGKSLAIVAIALIALGCVDQDPFGLSERRLAGDYRLVLWEDGKSYCLFGGDRSSLGEPVSRIGWNSRFILVDSPNNPNGVVKINVKTHEVTRPLTDAELAAIPEIADIKLLSAEAAWKSIPWKPPWSGA